MKEQFIHVNEEGNKRYYSDREMYTRHREDGPALEYADGGKEWWINDKRHREDGPAIEWASGDKEWWINDKLHREDGPAIEYADGDKEWWVDDTNLSEQEFNERMNPGELTLKDIAAKCGVSVGQMKIKE